MPIGAAIAVGSVASAGIGALAAGSAAGRQADAATSAAQIQSEAANRSADIQLGMFNTIRGDLTPFRTAGTAALPGYMALLGVPSTPSAVTSATPSTVPSAGVFTGGSFTGAPAGPDWNAYLAAYPDLQNEWATKQAIYQAHGITSPQQFAQWHYNTYGQAEGRQLPMVGAAAAAAPAAAPATATAAPQFDPAAMQSFLESTPGYQFTRDQGMQAVENTLTARGLGGLSGALGKGLSRFVTGLADQTYQSQLENYRNAASLGENASAQTGQFGTSAATGIGNTLVGGANAQAAGITGAAQAGAAGLVGAANSIGGGISGAANGLVTSKILGMYSPQAFASNPVTDGLI